MRKKFGGIKSINLDEIEEGSVIGENNYVVEPVIESDSEPTQTNHKYSLIDDFIGAFAIFFVIFGPILFPVLVTVAFPKFSEENPLAILLIGVSPIVLAICCMKRLTKRKA